MPEQCLPVRQRDENHQDSLDQSHGDGISKVGTDYSMVGEMRAVRFETRDYVLMRLKPQDAHGFRFRFRHKEGKCGALKIGSSSSRRPRILNLGYGNGILPFCYLTGSDHLHSSCWPVAPTPPPSLLVETGHCHRYCAHPALSGLGCVVSCQMRPTLSVYCPDPSRYGVRSSQHFCV
jgi:hypothetical protein